VARDIPSVAEPIEVSPGGDRQAAMRQAIAIRMEKANRDIPHYHLDLDVELAGPLGWLERHNRSRPIGDRVLPAALFLRATALAAVQVPELNGHWVDGGFNPADEVNLGVVISLRRGGLLTPAIVAAETLDIDETMAVLRAMVAGARSGAVRSSWMVEASLTVTNLGDNGADRVAGVIFPPQVALVGFGRIRERPWVIDGQVLARPVVTVSLAADHRATDGATGSRFLTALAKALTATPEIATEKERE
jgi:pyruvate dehydrogenase E2 component (dihydrolipoamide acetyltransferase)